MRKVLFIVMLCTAAKGMYAQKYITRTGKVSFFSSTPIENIEAFNNEAAAILDAQSGDVVYQVLIKSFKFEKQLMQDHFNEDYMESDKYPKSDFKGKITNLNEVNFSKDGTYNAKVSGKLTMHGVTKDVNTNGTITVKGGSARVNAKFHVKPKDYAIKIPSVAASKIADQIEVTVDTDLTKK